MIDFDVKINSWKNKLLDLGKRNRLINYQDTATSNFKILSPSLDYLWHHLVINKGSFEFPYIDDLSDDTVENENSSYEISPDRIIADKTDKELQKILYNIRNKSRMILSEQGVNILYLAFGFLKWYESPSSNQELMSPLVLVPVSLTLDSLTSPYVLKMSDDDIIANSTLLYKLEMDFGISLPEFEEDTNIEGYLKSVEEIISVNRWSIERDCALGLFSFAKINMYQDIEQNKEKIKIHPVIRAICGDQLAIKKNVTSEINYYDHDKTLPLDSFQIVDADSSQQDAILCAKKGLSFVLQGPPGTGKSQTITNIIAQSLADGKKVLFVSEKMAALEVVYKRLASARLDDFCLTLHSNKANKKEVLQQLRKALSLSGKKPKIKDEAFQTLEQLRANRDAINEYTYEISEKVQPLNKTIFEINGQLASLQNYEEVIFDIDNIDEITSHRFSEYILILTKFASTIGKMTGDYKSNPWYGADVGFVSHELRHDIGSNIGELIPIVSDISKLFDDLQKELSLKLNSSFGEFNNAILIMEISSKSPIVPSFWLDDMNLDELFGEIDKMYNLSSEIKSVFKLVNSIYVQINKLHKDELFEPINVLTLGSAKKELARLSNIINNYPCFSTWKGYKNFSYVKELYNTALENSKRYNKIKEEVLIEYENDIFSIDYKSIYKRFKTEYTSFSRAFKKQYHQDKRTIQGNLKQFVKKIDDEQVIDVLFKLNEMGNISKWFEDNSKTLEHCFNTYYDGIDTDFYSVYVDISVFELIEKVIKQLNLAIKLLNKFEEHNYSLKSHYGTLYKGVETDWASISQKVNWAIEFKRATKNFECGDQFKEYICTDISKIEKCLCYLNELKALIKLAIPNFKWFRSLFQDSEVFLEYQMPKLIDKLEHCVNGQSLLEEWNDFKQAKQQCIENGLGEYITKIDQLNIPSDSIVPIFKKRFFRLWLDAIMPSYPAVMNFRGSNHENLIKEFSKLDVTQFEIAKARVRKRLINLLPSFEQFGTGEINILQRELNKQKRIMPIRKLFKLIPNVLLSLKPCLMMSPLSVSLFLESESYEFDTVIFDEASQVCTENAIGAILRGKQIIIAGDSKQLPPTNFFNATLSELQDDDEFSDIDAYESVLEEAALLPVRTLLWHYRSKHEHLIAFSNAKVYYNNLITFPSSLEKGENVGVEYEFVKDGTYDQGGRNGNVKEAQRVAELVFNHFALFPDRSLGVITFGETQQQAIDFALRKMRKENARYEMFFKEDRENAFFVKNLENVQGDERDTIIFSIGYAKPPIGEMKMLFGPLSKAGGERRLNVAITRAKYNMKLVGSIMPEDIAVERINSIGPRLLRSYIEFAIDGPKSIIAEKVEDEFLGHDSPFEESVYNFLKEKGYSLAIQVGCSGYRIDIAVKHPTISGQYAIGIECDGATYHSARTARERDRLRQNILEEMGWKIYRVWSTDWIKDPVTQGKRLIEAVNNAIDLTTIEHEMKYNRLANKEAR